MLTRRLTKAREREWLTWTGQPEGWYQVGLHSNGDGGVGQSTDIGLAEIREWIISTAWYP